MNTRETMKLIKELTNLNIELIDLLEQFMDEFGKDDPYGYEKWVFTHFEDDLNAGIECNGCLQDIRYYKKEREDRIKRKKEELANETK